MIYLYILFLFSVSLLEFGKDERFRTKFIKKKEGHKTLPPKKVPKRLQVAGNDPDAKITGYLYKYSKTQGWTKVWIVLKSSVLYELRAAEDPVAYLDTAILGYSLEPEYILEVCMYVILYMSSGWRRLLHIHSFLFKGLLIHQNIHIVELPGLEPKIS